jgi:polar amino acid transport system substrate-binding protein
MNDKDTTMKQWMFGLLLGLTLISLPALAVDKVVRVCWENELKPPYLQLDANNQVSGIAVELVDNIFTRQKVKTHHILMPWKRCLLGLRDNSVDVVPNASFKKDRVEYGLYTKPLYATHLMLFYNKSKFPTPPVIKTVADMAHYRVAGVRGFNYDHYQNKIHIETGSPSRIALLQRLHLGRVDLAIEQKEVVFMLKKTGKVDLKNIGYVPDPVLPEEIYYMMVRKNYPGAEKLVHLVNMGIDAAKKDGTEKRIYEKYVGGG